MGMPRIRDSELRHGRHCVFSLHAHLVFVTKYRRDVLKKEHLEAMQSIFANVRRDYLHKASTAISKSHAMVCIEDLKVSNMSASAAGTTEQPGRNVRAKSGLNKAILDQGWFEFRRGEAHLCNEGPDMARFACEVNGAVRPSAAGTC